MDNVKRSTVAINAVSAGIAGLTSISCASMGDAEAAYFGLFVGFVLLCFAAGIYVTGTATGEASRKDIQPEGAGVDGAGREQG